MNLLLPITGLVSSLLGFMRTQRAAPIEVEVVSDVPVVAPPIPPHHPSIPDKVAVALVKVRDDLRADNLNYDWHKVRATTTKQDAGCVGAHLCRELGVNGYWQLIGMGLPQDAESRLTIKWPSHLHPSHQGTLNSQNAANRIDLFLATLE